MLLLPDITALTFLIVANQKSKPKTPASSILVSFSQRKVIMLRNDALFLAENSFAVFLAAANISLVAIIYGAYDITCIQQMFFIVLSLYASCRAYQKYMTDASGAKYRFFKGKGLEKVFALLMAVSMSVALYADYLVLSHF